MNNKEQENICEICEGDREVSDVEFHDGYGWVEAGTRSCVCVVQEKEELEANE